MNFKAIVLMLVMTALNFPANYNMFGPLSSAGVAETSRPAAPVSTAYGDFPLSFERNQGQTDPAVKFLARNGRQTLFLSAQEAVWRFDKPPVQRENGPQHDPFRRRTAALGSSVLRMQFDGADPNPRVEGLDETAGTSNYLDLADQAKSVTGVAHFGRVRYDRLYPDIDLVYYGNQGSLEYDFVVAPQADPSVISLSLAGADELNIQPDGSLAVRLGDETMTMGAPVVYQDRENGRVRIDGAFRIHADRRITFDVGEYDHGQELVIDPTVVFASYLGGSGDDYARGIGVDAAGNTYVVGTTSSANFPTTAGVLVPVDADPGSWDAFVTKINPQGTAKIYSTYLGAAGVQDGNAMAVDAAGRVTIVGDTTQSDPDGDAFAVRLNATGSSANPAEGGYIKVFGGSNDNTAEDVVLDAAGNAYITGETSSVGGNTFPASGGIQPIFGNGFYDAFLVRLDNTGAITYGTFLHILPGGDYDEFGYGVAVDPGGNVYVAGMVFSYCTSCDDTSAFIMKFNPVNNLFTYNQPFGGSGFDRANDLVVDASSNAYMVGTTKSSNFPLAGTPLQGAWGGNEDVFVSKFRPTGTLAYSTYLGTLASQLGQAIALDPAGNVYLAGTNNQFDVDYDAFALKLTKNGENYSLGYTYTFGGSAADLANDIAVDAAGNAYLSGATSSTDFPFTPGVFQPVKGDTSQSTLDAFVAKISPAAAPVNHPAADFDGDGKSDISLFRASNSAWYILQSSNGQTTSSAFGSAGDQIAPGDYDGDGKCDTAVFRPGSGTWYLMRSTAGFTGLQFGAATDVPVPADYDGDGKTDVAVFRPAGGFWYIIKSSDGTVRSQQFGANGDRPVTGDYDGDGKADLAVYRPSTGSWYMLNSTAGFLGVQFGLSTDRPAQADYDGDHQTDIAVFRPSNGIWYRLNSSNHTVSTDQFGINGDLPAPGDFDGDGKADLAVFRPSTGSWYALRSTAGFLGVQFGANGDLPVEAGYLPVN
jgi:hypothetical protein